MKHTKASQRAYRNALESIHRQLPLRHRIMSSLIHAPVLAPLCSLLASTVARPSAILYGAALAATTTLCMQLIAKQYGYALSGSEYIVAFGVGWLVGIIVDYALALGRGGRSK